MIMIIIIIMIIITIIIIIVIMLAPRGQRNIRGFISRGYQRMKEEEEDE